MSGREVFGVVCQVDSPKRAAADGKVDAKQEQEGKDTVVSR